MLTESIKTEFERKRVFCLHVKFIFAINPVDGTLLNLVFLKVDFQISMFFK